MGKRTSRRAQGWAGENVRAVGDQSGLPLRKYMSKLGRPSKALKAFVWGCESLLAAVESGSEFSLEELHLIDLYAEVIQQTSAAGLFH